MLGLQVIFNLFIFLVVSAIVREQEIFGVFFSYTILLFFIRFLIIYRALCIFFLFFLIICCKQFKIFRYKICKNFKVLEMFIDCFFYEKNFYLNLVRFIILLSFLMKMVIVFELLQFLMINIFFLVVLNDSFFIVFVVLSFFLVSFLNRGIILFLVVIVIN